MSATGVVAQRSKCTRKILRADPLLLPDPGSIPGVSTNPRKEVCYGGQSVSRGTRSGCDRTVPNWIPNHGDHSLVARREGNEGVGARALAL